MSAYDPPIEYPQSIFNPINWGVPSGDGIDTATLDRRYLKLAGGVERGSVTFQQGLISEADVEVDGDVNVSISNTYKVDNVDLVASQSGNSGKFLTTNGTQSSWDNPARLRVASSVDQSVGNVNDTLFDLPTYSLYLRNQYPTIPTDTNTNPNTGTTYTLTDPTVATINTTIGTMSAGDILQVNLTADLSMTATILINKQIKFIGPGKNSFKFLRSTTGLNTLFSITGSSVWIQDCNIEYTGAYNVSVEACVAVNSSGYVNISNCRLGINEFGITIANASNFTINGCSFVYTSTFASANTHRCIGLSVTGTGTTSFITNNTFTPSTGTNANRQVFIGHLGAVKGTLVISGNTSTSTDLLRQFYLRESVTESVNFFVINNTWYDNNGAFIFYGATPLSFAPLMYFQNNTCSTTTGMLKIDSPSSTTFGTGYRYFFSGNTVTGAIGAGYASGALNGSNLIAYNTSVFSTALNWDTTTTGWWEIQTQNQFETSITAPSITATTITATTINGSVTTATNATNTAITASSTNATFYPTFVSATTGNLPQLVDTNLTYNPSTDTLTATTFSGALSGNASTATTATNANNVACVADATNASQYLTFVSAQTGNNPVRTDAGLLYNPSTDLLQASGEVRGAYGNAGRYVELSSTTDTARVDFHSKDTATNDYDGRIQCTNGTNAVNGTGTMNYYGTEHFLNGTIKFNGSLQQQGVGSFNPFFRIIQGTASFSSTGTYTISFPVTLTAVPIICITARITFTGYAFFAQVYDATTTGFSFKIYGSTIANPANLFGPAGDGGTVNYIAFGIPA